MYNYKKIWLEFQANTNRSFGLLIRKVSISRNRAKIERLYDWKEFTSKTVGRSDWFLQHFSHYKSMLIFSDTQGQLSPQSMVESV